MVQKPEATIENVVASVVLHVDIPLEKLAAKLPNTEYNPEQFPGLVLRLLDNKITALVFSSGRIVCTGAKSEKMVKVGVKEIIKEIAKINVKVTKKPEITIQNMVASGNLGMQLNLNQLAFKLENSEYEPERFPGLVYKPQDSHVTFLLFGTGRIVATGAKNEEEVDEAVSAVYYVALGDCRRALNTLQSAAALSKTITESTIYDIASVASPEEVKNILLTALSGDFRKSRTALHSLMIKYGLSGLDVVKQIQSLVWELPINDKNKVFLIDRIGEYEFRIVEGSDEFIQLEALLAQFYAAGKSND